jgi:hypothetical protein
VYGEVVLSGGVSGCGWFSFLGEGWQGTNNGNGSGSFTGRIGLSMTGNVGSNILFLWGVLWNHLCRGDIF